MGNNVSFNVIVYVQEQQGRSIKILSDTSPLYILSVELHDPVDSVYEASSVQMKIQSQLQEIRSSGHQFPRFFS